MDILGNFENITRGISPKYKQKPCYFLFKYHGKTEEINLSSYPSFLFYSDTDISIKV